MPLREVCALDALPAGGRLVARVAGVPIILWNVEGRIRATARNCPHQDFPLDGGSLRGTVVTCGLHGYQSDVATGACLTFGGIKLATYPVEVRGGKVWVDVGR